MRVNYHTHTYRCTHASGSEEDYVKSAIASNLSILGISDHIAYPDDRSSNRMMHSEVNAYINECFRLRTKYKKDIKILVGFESEYSDDCHEYYEYLFNECKIDYLVFGQHSFIEDSKFYNSFDLTSTKDYIIYAKSVAKALKTNYFKIFAHPDLVFINNLAFDDNCRQAIEILISAIKDSGIIIEFNANGIRRGFKDFPDGQRLTYPHMKFWKRVQEENIKTIISSDCHMPEQMWDYAMDDAYIKAEELKLNLVYEI